MKIEAKIQKWGNGLALRVAGVMRDIPKFENGTVVEVDISEDGFVVKKQTPANLFPFSEDEMLADLTPESAHADLLAEPLGSEIEYK